MESEGSITNNIRVLRAKYRMTQKDLAEKIGVSRQTVMAIENQKYNPSLILGFKIAKAFDRDITDIFKYAEEE